MKTGIKNTLVQDLLNMKTYCNKLYGKNHSVSHTGQW